LAGELWQCEVRLLDAAAPFDGATFSGRAASGKKAAKQQAAIAWMEAWRAASQRATGSRPTAATDEADGRHSTGGGSVLPSPARAGLVQDATPGAGAAAAAGEGEEVDDGCLSDE